MNFLTPAAFIGGLIALPIILLYMLRLRRREVMISSTYLWRQVIHDQEANTPWQRLRRNLLLILQLIILALLVIALARPFVTISAVSAGQVTVLLDASASMNALDVAGGSRFEQAKSEISDIISTLSAGDRMTLIRVAEEPEILASSTTNRTQLRNALRSAEPSMAQADWESALNLAAAGSANTDDFEIVIVSDGGLPNDAGLPGVIGDVIYVPVGTSSNNVAITVLATRALPGEKPQLFAQMTNYSDVEARVIFTIWMDGKRLTAINETIPPNSARIITSEALQDDFTTLEATLTQSVNAIGEDYLSIDDAAYAVSNQSGTRRALLVTQGNIYIEQVLRSLPGLETARTPALDNLPEGFDIYIFDNFVPKTLPEGDLFFIDPPDSTPLFTLGEENQNTGHPTIAEDDPRMTFVDVEQMNIFEFRDVSNVDWAHTLLEVEGGPVLLAGEINDRQVAILPFNLRESDLPLQIAWPIIMSNLIEWFTPRSIVTKADSLNVGEPLVIRPPFEVDTIKITSPEGDAQTLPVARDTVIFIDTDTPGLYNLELLVNGEVTSQQPFAVNLFSPLESDITPIAETALTLEGVEINTDLTEEQGQQEFWPPIAALALAVLLIEWYVYHRRLRAPTIFTPLRRRQASR